MRLLKFAVAVLLLVLIAAFGTVAWLGATEPGTRWLIDQLLARSPVSIEIEGLQGSLVDGLDATSVAVDLPVARIHVTAISIAWRPADLVAGRIVLTETAIGDLTVDLVEDPEPAVSADDPLFWLQLPVDVRIIRGHIDRLRVVKAEFEQVDIDGALGWGRLNVNQATARIMGVDLQFAGRLSGSAPGELEGELQWQWPAMGYTGGGTFDGDIEVLRFAHQVKLPDAVGVTGEIMDLFSRPTLIGVATWDVVNIPGEQPLVGRAGEVNIETDFLSARIDATGLVQFAELPEMPARVEGLLRLDGATIDRFQVDAFEGRFTGDGELQFAEEFSGQLNVGANGVALTHLLPDYPAVVDFDSKLQINSTTDIDIAIARYSGELYKKTLAGHANVTVREGALAAIDGDLRLASNIVVANLRLQPALAGTATVSVRELADFWPAAKGEVDADVTVAGSIAKPRFELRGRARDLSYEAFSALELETELAYAHGREVAGTVSATGLNYGGTDLGALQARVAGKPEDHTAQWSLAGGVVDADVKMAGSWDGTLLRERFTDARIQPRDFAAWELTSKPELTVSSEAARLEGHCWAQESSSLCMDESMVSKERTTSSFKLQQFPLTVFTRFLPAEVKVTGWADAEGNVRVDGDGMRGRLVWRQGETVLAYQLEDDILETRISDMVVSVDTNDRTATLDARVLGPDGLNVKASASVEQPVNNRSALSGELTGLLPDISLLRPLILRVADTGAMAGVGRVDLRIGGTVGDPVFRGGAFIEGGLLQLPKTGTTLTDINISATSQGGDELRLDGDLRAGEGKGRVSGKIMLTDSGEVVADVLLDGENLATVQLPQLSLLSSPQLRLRVDDDGVDVSGRVVIPEAVARIRELPPEAVKRSADVVVHADEQKSELASDEKVVTGDIEVVLGDDVQFYGFGLESRLDGSLRLTQRPGRALRGNGTVRVRDGFLTGYGKELRVDRGTLTFTGPLDDPVVDVQVSRDTTYENRRYTVGLRLSGTASNLKTEPFSRPAMSEQDILAFLLLDRPASSSGEDTDLSGALLAMGLGQMMPGDGNKFGLDEISFEGAEFEETSVVAGKRISEDLYIRYVFGLFGQPGQFRIRYRLSRGISLEATTGGTSQALDLIYLIERE